jgi:DNA-directed RNA polymerase specialized sigma24 family protein
LLSAGALLPIEPDFDWNDLLLKVKDGQTEARNALCQALSVRLRLIAQYRLWGWSQHELEDLVQESLVTLLQKLPQVKSNPQMYAGEILRHKIGDALRRRKMIKVPLQTDPADDSHPREAVPAPAIHPEENDGFIARIEARDRVDLVKTAIRNLSPFCRAFFLGILEGQSAQELWRLFKRLEPGWQRSAFDKRIFDCRKRLKQLIQDQI